MMKWTEAYIALGGNIGDTARLFHAVIEHLYHYPKITDIEISSIYETTPVGGPDLQPNYLNAVCRFNTAESIYELRTILTSIEIQLGKTISLVKNAPRTIDLDLLFFGDEIHNTPDLQVPHPRWNERLFVLKPLSDLCETLNVPQIDGSVKSIDLNTFINRFSNPNRESIRLYSSHKPETFYASCTS